MKHARMTALFALVAVVALTGAAAAGQLVSSKRNVKAYTEYRGYFIVPAGTQAMPGDQSAAQLFELVRPDARGNLTIGRLYTSCTCIQLSAEKKTYRPGERVLLTLRNVRPTSGNTYPFYVQITGPVRTTLRHDAYVISDQFVPAPEPEPEPAAEEPEAPAEEPEAEEPPVETPAEDEPAEQAPAEEQPETPAEAPPAETPEAE